MDSIVIAGRNQSPGIKRIRSNASRCKNIANRIAQKEEKGSRASAINVLIGLPLQAVVSAEQN